MDIQTIVRKYSSRYEENKKTRSGVPQPLDKLERWRHLHDGVLFSYRLLFL